jgi:Leucine-rich repeat (LRR) protein
LNQSNNKLGAGALQIICQIQSIRDLKLANNDLSGELRTEIGHLANLESLDVHGNRLVSLPENLGSLSRLRILNVAENLIISLPFEALNRLPLTELIATKNNISGALMPTNIDTLATLQVLSVANNALTCLSASGNLILPAIQHVNIMGNRISYLPDVSSWTQLMTLAAEDNNISEVPEGFTSLQKLRTADFTGNSFVRINEHIGMMENLEVFRVANNPLRERKFLTMATDDLKRILRDRLVPEEGFETADEFDTQEEVVIESNGNASPDDSCSVWQVKAGGILDRSSTALRTLEWSDAERVAAKYEVKSVELHHNHLSQLPPALSCFAITLTSLNLTHNEFKADDYLQAELALPQLRDLNISSNTISSLGPILHHLSAPSLEKLDVSFNRVRCIPVLRKHFPCLITLLASDNSIEEINVDAMKGLRAVDLSSNDIAHLPPKLGLIQSIRQLDLRGNRFRVPRYTILEKGTEAVMGWLRDKVPIGEREDECEEEEAEGK